MSSEKVNIRKFFITEGMTPEDVRKSPNATEQQKTMADIFDSDGVKGYSQREADVFNSTAIADHGKQGVSLWTRYADGSCKETKCQGDITSFKFAPQGELKPYGTTSQKANPAEKKISFDKKSYNFAELYKKCLQEIKVTSEQVNALKEKYTFNSEEAAIEYAKVYYATGSAINVIKDATGAYYNQVVADCKKKSETATDEEKAKLKTEISDAESLLHKVRNEAQAKLDIARKNALSKCAKPEQKQTVAVKKTNSEQTPKKLTNQKHTVHTQGHNIRVVAIEYYPNGNMKRRIFKVIRANGCTPDKSRIYIENFDSREKLVSEQRFESSNVELNMNY